MIFFFTLTKLHYVFKHYILVSFTIYNVSCSIIAQVLQMIQSINVVKEH